MTISILQKMGFKVLPFEKWSKLKSSKNDPKWGSRVILTIKIDLGAQIGPRSLFSCILVKVDF